MEGHRNDARVARDRCLNALAGCSDLETAQSLWRAACRYNERMRTEARQADTLAAAPLARRLEGGSFRGAREW